VSVLVVVLVAAVVGAIAWYAYRSKQKRREALFVFATQHRMDYSREDTFDLPDAYGFALFRKGDGRGCENVMTGTWNGLAVREADYWYYEQSSDGKGGTTRTYSYFSVVLADLSCSVPHLTIGRETLMTKLADHLGFRDIEFESEQFNRQFRVGSDDRQFAFQMIDARMMEWLLQTGGEFGFEVMGPNLLVSVRRRPPAELPALFEAAVAFNAHIPDLVRRDRATGTPPPGTPNPQPDWTERSPS